MKEIKPLTSLRAIAAFLVFMFHYAYVYSPDSRGIEFSGEWIPLLPLWRQGQVGVSIFFVLSGFLITRIYFDGIARRTVSLRVFFVKRVARIWPLFVVFALIQHTVLVIQGHSVDSGFLVTMTMVQGFFADLCHEGLPTAWSLTVEETFYVLAPVLFLVLAVLIPHQEPDRRSLSGVRFWRIVSAVGLITLVLVLLGELFVSVIARAGLDWRGFFGNRFHMWHATLLGRFPEFAVGIIAAFIHRDADLPDLLRGRRASALLAASFLGIGACMWGKDLVAAQGGVVPQAVTYFLAYLLVVLTALMILALTVSRGPLHHLLSTRLLVYLGKISYGFYLIQVTVMIAPLVALTDKLGWVRLPVLFVLTNLACVAFYALVEVPARRWIVTRWASSG